MKKNKINKWVPEDMVGPCFQIAQNLEAVFGSQLSAEEGVALYRILGMYSVIFVDGSGICQGALYPNKDRLLMPIHIAAIVASLSREDHDPEWWKDQYQTQKLSSEICYRFIGQIFSHPKASITKSDLPGMKAK